MSISMPTYSICNLLGADRCMTEFVVMPLKEFLAQNHDISFPHKHHFYQIVLFTTGGGAHSIDFKRYEISPRQVYYMAPGQIHTWEFDDGTDGYLINFNESFFTSICHNPHFVRQFPLFSTINNESVNTLDDGCFSEITRTLEQMLEEYRNKSAYVMDMLRGMLMTILIRLSREVPTTLNGSNSKHNLELIRQFEQLIEQHFRQQKLPREYAELMYITPNHLNALTNVVAGKSAGELIRERILLEAKRLLVNSDLMVGQIAESLNFEDNAYFARFFKKYLGASPEEFRAANGMHVRF